MPAERRILVPPEHSKPVGSYSPGVAVDLAPSSRLVFVTGQVATDSEGTVLCQGDPAGQTHVVFDRIAAILAEAGAELGDLVSLVVYLPDLSHFHAVSSVRNERLGAHAPSSTLVEVSRLVEAGCLVEISGVAAR